MDQWKMCLRLGNDIVVFGDDFYLSRSSLQRTWNSILNLISMLNLNIENTFQNIISDIEKILSKYFAKHSDVEISEETNIKIAEKDQERLIILNGSLKDKIKCAFSTLPDETTAKQCFQFGISKVNFFDCLNFPDLESSYVKRNFQDLDLYFRQIKDLNQNKEIQEMFQYYIKILKKYQNFDCIADEDRNSILKTEKEIDELLFK